MVTASEVLEAERHLDEILAAVLAGLSGSIHIDECVEQIRWHAIAADAALRRFRARVHA
jgi:hypothetical protein